MLGLTMRTASLVGTSVSSTSTNSSGRRSWTFAFYLLERSSAFFFNSFLSQIELWLRTCFWEGKASSEKKNRNLRRVPGSFRMFQVPFDGRNAKGVMWITRICVCFVNDGPGMRASRAHGGLIFPSPRVLFRWTRKPIKTCFIHFFRMRFVFVSFCTHLLLSFPS